MLDEATRAYDAGVDALVIDIEDAVPGPEKSAARDAMIEWLARRPAWVRVNDTESLHWADDLTALKACPGVLGGMLAKVESARQVADTAAALPAGTRIVALIESARGIRSVFDIAEEPATFRLAFGSGDFRRDTGIGDDPLALAYARSQLVIANAAAGIAEPVEGTVGGSYLPALARAKQLLKLATAYGVG